MKLHYINRSTVDERSFTARNNSYPHFLKIWHYHAELELVLIHKSTGTRFIGDNISKFESGDLVLIGKNLPHMWLNDDDYFKDNHNLVAEASSIHFTEDFLGEPFLKIPEMKDILELFSRAVQGVRFIKVKTATKKKIKSLIGLSGYEGIMSLIDVLHDLSIHQDIEILASNVYLDSFKSNGNNKMDRACQYIFQNFNNEISLSKVAEVVHMNPSAFSRLFKRIYRKTFSSYLNEIRIGYACKLLLEENDSITGICYESGFNNVSNFNRQFRKLKGAAPKEYINSYLPLKAESKEK